MTRPALSGPLAPALPSLNEKLTERDQETLAHLLRSGIGENTLRAVRSDLAYLEAWSHACTGDALPWPPTEEIALRFIAHHLWDPDRKVADPDHGMPEDVRAVLKEIGQLRVDGPHAPATVERRIASWRSLCRWRGCDHPFSSPAVTRTLRAAIRASARPRHRKSRKPVELDLLEELLDHLDLRCSSVPDDAAEVEAIRLHALRDRALLAVMFASGGRRRSEIAGLQAGQIELLDPIVTADPAWPQGLPSAAISLGRTKTTDAGDGSTVFISGRVVRALEAWRRELPHERGPIFPSISRWGVIAEKPMTGAAVNAILKKRLKEIGLDPKDYSAHGIRAGYITSTLKAGIPAPEIMEQTKHRSLETLMGYFKDEQQRQSRAARML